MLRILALIFMASLLLGPAMARAGFFEEKDTSVQESGCNGQCDSKAVSLNPDLKEKVAAIEKTISNNLNKKEDTYGNEITLFIDLSNKSSDTAVNALIKFKKDNPAWRVKGVIVGNQKNLKEKLLKKLNYFINDIEFSIDLSGSLAKDFGILNTPAYVITYNGRHHKITGFADLNDEISKLYK